MPIETVTTVSLDNIEGIEFVCAKCKAVAIRLLGQGVPLHCSCGESTWPVVTGNDAERAQELLVALQDYAMSENKWFTVRLRLKEEKNGCR